MAVRNIHGIGNPKPIPIYVWIPPSYSFVWKIEVVSGGVSYDITNLISNDSDFSNGVTSTIGDFSFTIDNSRMYYTGLFQTYDTLNVYMDYATTATTKVFSGLIERISKNNSNLTITGRSLAAKYIGKNVTYAGTNVSGRTALVAIINSYFSDLTTDNTQEDGFSLTLNYSDKPFLDCIIDICQQTGFDAFIDVNNDFNFFPSSSRVNSTDAIVHNYNRISTGDFSPDATQIYNKIKVYGINVDGNPILATAQDTTSQAKYGIKELKITDGNIKNVAQAQARANYELAQRVDPPTIGTITSLGLPTLLPGEKLRISDPINGLDPAEYPVYKYTHKFFVLEPVQTEVTIQKERISIPIILKKSVNFQAEVTSTNNPYELDYSYIWTFNSASTNGLGSFTDTAISYNASTDNGVLELATGKSTGTWTSPTLSVSDYIKGVEVKLEGTNVTGTEIYISSDGGQTFTALYSSPTLTVLGKDIQIKLTLNSSTTQISSVFLGYKFNI